MNCRTFLRVALIVLSCSAPTQAADDLFFSFSYSNKAGKMTHHLLYSVPYARIEAQPTWKPAEQPIPLLPEKAVALAVAWAQSHLPAGTQVTAEQITLRQTRNGLADARWFYTVELSHGQDKSKFDPYELVVVFFDGTIVEPAK